MTEIAIYTLLFYAGAIIGSFQNVLIYRLPRGLSVVRPPSHCPHCTNPIRFYDNVPIFSYLFLRGRCRDCGQKISGRYPLVETLTGLVFGLLYFRFGFTEKTLFYGILLVSLIVIVFIDIDFHRIPNVMVVSTSVIGALLLPVLNPRTIADAGLGLLCGAGVMLFWSFFGRWLFKKECLGAGDIKLAILAGIFLGLPGIVLALFISFILAGVIGGGLVLFKGLKMDGHLPYAPFLAAGTLTVVVAGQSIINWYLGLL